MTNIVKLSIIVLFLAALVVFDHSGKTDTIHSSAINSSVVTQ
ncbi:hypothetical protein EDC44_1101 [Cricetibacter osteomyelitidis]|uniref:Uncharacterized protein n=1 Tax=Cricetibacter osteomyelitidis TaxID=1521931 RepID=A0A4R2SZI8_9PAST|nr:hypothetical protein EDC44_1101 [Cricetibacter osteomyelitidis]